MRVGASDPKQRFLNRRFRLVVEQQSVLELMFRTDNSEKGTDVLFQK